MRIDRELTNALEQLVHIRMRLHAVSVNAELETGQPQFPLMQVLENVDKTITVLTKETRAVCNNTRIPTAVTRLRSFVGLKHD